MVRKAPASRNAGRRGRALAAAVALGVIATAPNQMGAHAAEPAPRGAGVRPVGQFPAFVLDRGRYTGFDAPESGVQLAPSASTTEG